MQSISGGRGFAFVADQVIEEKPEHVPQPRRQPRPHVETRPAGESGSLPATNSLRRSRPLLVLTMVVLGVFVALVLTWLYTSHPKSAVSIPDEVAKRYLTAVALGDNGTQQQLASDASKGATFPSWFTMIDGRVERSAISTGSGMVVNVTVTLTPVSGVTTPAIIDVVSRPYRIDLTLVNDGGDWRVDQQQLLDALHQAMKGANPGVTLPPWE